tara:strand:+ start:267 stop:653 length:387 start_codon:yes stop_codon:yes gene_type:complete
MMVTLECYYLMEGDMKNVDHAVLFFKLREILAKHEPFLKVIVDDEGYYRLFTPTNRPFIGIKVQKKHVGIYVLPVYYNPELIGNMSSRQVGKCTFAFKHDNDEMIEHLPDFFERCFFHCVETNQIPMH